MKAKKVYEFKRTRKQGLSKQTEIGLDYYKKQTIIDWFKKWKPEWEERNEYIILNDLSIKVYEDLNLSGTNVDYLPEKLILGKFVFLNLENTPITKLPKEITIPGFLDLSYSNIKELSGNITGYINLRYTPIKELPDNLKLNSSLILNNTQIKELPKGLKIGGNLILNNIITELPDDLYVKKYIIVNKEQYDLFSESKFKDKIKITN